MAPEANPPPFLPSSGCHGGRGDGKVNLESMGRVLGGVEEEEKQFPINGGNWSSIGNFLDREAREMEWNFEEFLFVICFFVNFCFFG